MMPILVIFANTIAIAGAFVVSDYFLNVPFNVFFNSVRQFFVFSDLTGGLIKTVVFGGVTALLGCHIGFRTEGGAEGVGLATIRSFVMSAAMILILDYFLWTLLF
jgi:phospholipid/cholesterol/gamma-HCH transport system permease protein